MGGPHPCQSPPRRLYSGAHGLPISMADLWGSELSPLGLPQGPNGPPLSGEYTREKARRWLFTYSPVYPPRWPKYSGTIRGSRRAFYRVFGLSWETSSHSRVLFTWLPVYIYVFFSRFLESRNYKIQIVALREPLTVPEYLGGHLGGCTRE